MSKQLEKWLSSLDADVVIRQITTSAGRLFEKYPSVRYPHGDWDVVFLAIPKRIETRGKQNARLIGSRNHEFSMVNLSDNIRASIKGKTRFC
jgi:hypothetical protein